WVPSGCPGPWAVLRATLRVPVRASRPCPHKLGVSLALTQRVINCTQRARLFLLTNTMLCHRQPACMLGTLAEQTPSANALCPASCLNPEHSLAKPTPHRCPAI